MTPAKQRIVIIIGVLVLAGIIIMFTFLYKKTDGVDYKDVIKAKDETIKVLQEQRKEYENQIDEMKVVISDHKRKDSLLIIQINSTKQSIKSVDERLKNIPDRISRIADNNDSLRVAISNL